jgi:hypothetical protein
VSSRLVSSVPNLQVDTTSNPVARYCRLRIKYQMLETNGLTDIGLMGEWLPTSNEAIKQSIFKTYSALGWRRGAVRGFRQENVRRIRPVPTIGTGSNHVIWDGAVD